ncbi:MAG: sensor histidine kinase [Magnetovibrionaceae bacterium]
MAKNSYDADALECIIKLDNVSKPGGSITISDDGTGMSISGIENSWLVLGKSQKRGALTPKFNRSPAGDKGLGRLSALRLGRKAILKTRPESKPGFEHSVTIDWDAFDQALFVESVPLRVTTKRTKKRPGSDIIIQDLVKPLVTDDVKRLSKNLVLLSDPFRGKSSFTARLSAPGFDQYELLVKDAYFESADFKLTATLDGEGKAHFYATDWKGTFVWEGEGEQVYDAPKATFSFWVFLLSGKNFASKDVSMKEVRSWLQVAGGIHIYENGMRVAPYGGADADWLKLNQFRVASPEERPSTNTSIGRVVIEENDGRLTQKTDRNGYIENTHFEALRSFGMEALNWLASNRMRVAEIRRAKEKSEAEKQKKAEEDEFDQAIDQAAVDDKSKDDLKAAARKVKEASDRVTKALEEDLQLYRSLATAGITSAVFSHQIAHPIQSIEELIDFVEEDLPPESLSSVEESIQLIKSEKDKLLAYTRMPLRLLRAEKRKWEVISFCDCVETLFEQYDLILDSANIKRLLNLPKEEVKILGSTALIEGIFSNFISNSIKAFQRGGTPADKRKIIVDGNIIKDFLEIKFSDSGPGILDISIDDIWLPGRTTADDDRGTGFGLTIVKDSVRDLNGTIHALKNGKLGGAEFIMRLPIQEEL